MTANSASTAAATPQWGRDRTGPVWGARAYAPTGGQDHLGLGSVSSDQVLPLLSPGINVQTVHARYWSFYSYVLDEFWQRDLARSRASFAAFYRPREALFSFACLMCPHEEHRSIIQGGVVGSQRTAAPARTDSEFDPGFAYIKGLLGGYGQYYKYVMEYADLLVSSDPAAGVAFDAPTPEGRALAAGYRRAVERTRLVRDYFTGELVQPVPRDVLEEFAEAGCLCQLPCATGADLPLMQDMFLHAGSPREADARRATFRFLLDVSRSCQQVGIAASEFRQLAYFRRLEAGRYSPRPDLQAVARRWRLYQGREYFSFVFNRLWAWLTRVGSTMSHDGLTLVPMPDLWRHVTRLLDRNTFAQQLGLSGPAVTSQTITAEFADLLSRELNTRAGLDTGWSRHDTLDEHALYAWCDNTEDDAETLVAMLALLLVLHLRFGTPKRQAELAPDIDLLTAGGNTRIGMAGLFSRLSRELMRGRTLAEDLQWLIADYVIAQHERVAVRKLPEDTFRFRGVGDSLRFFAMDAPVGLNNSRFDALSNVICELGFVSPLHERRRKLTESGKRLLEDGDLAAGALKHAVVHGHGS